MGSVRHFTESSGAGETYDNDQQSAVTEYLRTGYPTGVTDWEISVEGKIYKVLKRASVTAFYDENGSTLFDVTNSRLAKEYGELIETTSAPKTEMGKVIASIERRAFDAAVQEPERMPTGDDIEGKPDVIPMGTASLAKMPSEPAEMSDIAEQAVKKLNGELGRLTGSEKTFAEMCIEFLIRRCRESQSLAEDICQQHKTWKKCYGYIYSKAKSYLGGKSGPVLDATVFEWVEDYYHLDDKAKEEKKAKEEAERQKKTEERQKQSAKKTAKTAAKSKAPEAKTPALKEEKPVTAKPEAPKKKSKKKELEGQMDLFSMMGM